MERDGRADLPLLRRGAAVGTLGSRAAGRVVPAFGGGVRQAVSDGWFVQRPPKHLQFLHSLPASMHSHFVPLAEQVFQRSHVQHLGRSLDMRRPRCLGRGLTVASSGRGALSRRFTLIVDSGGPSDLWGTAPARGPVAFPLEDAEGCPPESPPDAVGAIEKINK